MFTFVSKVHQKEIKNCELTIKKTIFQWSIISARKFTVNIRSLIIGEIIETGKHPIGSVFFLPNSEYKIYCNIEDFNAINAPIYNKDKIERRKKA